MIGGQTAGCLPAYSQMPLACWQCQQGGIRGRSSWIILGRIPIWWSRKSILVYAISYRVRCEQPSRYSWQAVITRSSEASLLFHKLVSDKRLSCCAVESSMSEIRARRARQLTENFRPAAR